MDENLETGSSMDDLLDEHHLLRRIKSSNPNMVKLDKNLNVYRPTSACFSDPELSVTHEENLVASGKELESALADYPDYGLVALNIGFVRNELDGSQAVLRDPVENNVHHCLIQGPKPKSISKALSKACIIRISCDPKDLASD